MKTTVCLFGALAVIIGGSQAAETNLSNTSISAERSCAGEGKAIVRGLRGNADFTMPGSTVPKTLQVGMVLPEGATIATKADGVADLAMVENGVVVRVTPGTKLNLEKLRYVTLGKRTIRTHTILNVPQGRILTNGPRDKQTATFEVITPEQGTHRSGSSAMFAVLSEPAEDTVPVDK